MKNLILTMLTLLTLTTLSNAQLNQWGSVPFVDEFERPTGDTAYVLLCEGKFSNSATSNNTNFLAKFVHDKKAQSISIYLYEYKSAPSAKMNYDASFGTIMIMSSRDSNEVKKFNNIFAPSSGGLYITKKDNPELYDIITKDTSIYFVVSTKLFGNKYSESKYSFYFKL